MFIAEFTKQSNSDIFDLRSFLKKIILVFLFMSLFPAFSLSQENFLFYSVGYNVSDVDLDGMNFVIGRFNVPQDTVTRQMNTYSGNMSGFSLSGGVILQDRFLLGLGFTQRRSTMPGTQVIDGVKYNADLSTRVNSLDFNVGMYLFKNDDYGLLLGSGFSLVAPKVRYRTYIATDVAPGYTDLNNVDETQSDVDKYTLGITPFAQFYFSPWVKELQFMVRPYYQFQMSETDYTYVNEYLNPDTWQNDNPASATNKLNNYGIQVRLNVVIKAPF